MTQIAALAPCLMRGAPTSLDRASESRNAPHLPGSNPLRIQIRGVDRHVVFFADDVHRHGQQRGLPGAQPTRPWARNTNPCGMASQPVGGGRRSVSRAAHLIGRNIWSDSNSQPAWLERLEANIFKPAGFMHVRTGAHKRWRWLRKTMRAHGVVAVAKALARGTAGSRAWRAATNRRVFSRAG